LREGRLNLTRTLPWCSILQGRLKKPGGKPWQALAICWVEIEQNLFRRYGAMKETSEQRRERILKEIFENDPYNLLDITRPITDEEQEFLDINKAL